MRDVHQTTIFIISHTNLESSNAPKHWKPESTHITTNRTNCGVLATSKYYFLCFPHMQISVDLDNTHTLSIRNWSPNIYGWSASTLLSSLIPLCIRSQTSPIQRQTESAVRYLQPNKTASKAFFHPNIQGSGSYTHSKFVNTPQHLQLKSTNTGTNGINCGVFAISKISTDVVNIHPLNSSRPLRVWS